MKNESTEFQEIFGSSSVRESLAAPVSYAKSESQLPTDNPLWDYERVTSASAERVADEAFIRDVSGYDWTPVPRQDQPARALKQVKDFSLLDGIVGAEFIPDVTTFTKRAKETEIQKAAPARRKAIRACFEKHLKPLCCKHWENGFFNDFDFRLDELAERGVQLVNQSILMEA